MATIKSNYTSAAGAVPSADAWSKLKDPILNSPPLLNSLNVDKTETVDPKSRPQFWADPLGPNNGKAQDTQPD